MSRRVPPKNRNQEQCRETQVVDQEGVSDLRSVFPPFPWRESALQAAMLSHGLYTCASHAPSSELDAPACFVNSRLALPEEVIIKWTQQDRSRTPWTL